MEIIFHSHANKTHIHKKGCAPSLVLKVRVFETRKWPIKAMCTTTENYLQSPLRGRSFFTNDLLLKCNTKRKVNDETGPTILALLNCSFEKILRKPIDEIDYE